MEAAMSLNEEILDDDDDYGDLEDADEDALLRDDEEPTEEHDESDVVDEGSGENPEDSAISNLDNEEERSERKDKFSTERQPIKAPEPYTKSNNSYQKRRPFQRTNQNTQRYNNFNRNNQQKQHYHQKNRLPVQNFKHQDHKQLAKQFNHVLNILNRPSNAQYQRNFKPYLEEQSYEVFNQDFPAPSTTQSRTVLINPHFQGVVTVDNNNSWSNQSPQPQPQIMPHPQYPMDRPNYQSPMNQWSQTIHQPTQPYGSADGPGVGHNFAMQGPPMGQGPIPGPMGQMPMQGPMGQGPMHGPMGHGPMGQGPMQGPMGQGPMQGPMGQGPMQGPMGQGPMQGPMGQRPMQGPMGQGPMQGPMGQGPVQGPMGQGPMQGPMGQGPMQGPMGQGPMQGPMGQGPMQGPMGHRPMHGPMGQGPMQGPMGHGTMQNSMGQQFQAGMQPAMFQGQQPRQQFPYQNGPPVQNTNWSGQECPMYPNQQFCQQDQGAPNQPNRMIIMQPLPPATTSNHQMNNNFPPNNQNFNNNFPPPQNNNSRVFNQKERFGHNQKQNFVNNNQRFNQKRKSGEGNPSFQNKKILKNVEKRNEATKQVERTPEVKIGHRPAVSNNVVEDEDPQTQDLRLKIEEQRRKREKVLKWKEENRRKQLLSANESVNVQNLTPVQTQQKTVKKRMMVAQHSNIVEIRTGNRNNICLTNGRKITKFQRLTSKQPKTVVQVEPDQNEIDTKHLSSFLADRTILARDESLMDTRAVFINNLSSSTPDKKVFMISKNIGNVQKLHRDKNERHATVVFKSVASAHAFYKKYQRHMLDLSMIEVTLKPMAEIEHLL